jgi:hypothetical protein
VYLLLLRPWVFPALEWSNHVRSARSGIWVASLELKERASDQEHAASAASIAFSISVRVDWKHQARGESPELAIEWAISHQCTTATPRFIYRIFQLIVLSQTSREMM